MPDPLADLSSGFHGQSRSQVEQLSSDPEGLPSGWSLLESGLDEWDDLCHRMDTDDATHHGTGMRGLDSVHDTLGHIVKLLATNQRAQAVHGRATSLMARQVISCMKGTEAEALAKTVQVRRLGGTDIGGATISWLSVSWPIYYRCCKHPLRTC